MMMEYYESKQEYERNSNGWISVKERMPEPCKSVLVYVPTLISTFAVYRRDNKWYYWGAGIDKEYEETVWGEITHWRPMPEPPVIPDYGEWIADSDGLMCCSKCGEVAMQRMFFDTEKRVYDCRITPSKFCPHCGKEMRIKEG